MFDRIDLKKNNNGTYDIHISYCADAEFGFEFLSADNIKSNVGSILEYVRKTSNKVKVNAIKILINGAVITTMSLSSFMNIYGAATTKYSMAYINTGTPTEQIGYITRTNNSLNTVSPCYFNINKDGSLSLGNVSKTVIDYAHANNMKVIPFLSNHWDRASGIIALDNIEVLSTQVASYISEYNLDGVNVDIENVTEVERDKYTDFVTKLRQKIPAIKEVSVAVAANPKGWTDGWHGSYDYTKLAQNSDYLMIMSYDEHWHGSDSGPVSSISFVENSIKYALSQTTADKIVIGIPFYGRIWSANKLFDGEGITLDRVAQLVSLYKGTVTYDSVQKAPKAIFTVKTTDTISTLNGKKLTAGTYTVWYENDSSIEAKISLINQYKLKGVGAWALGQEHTTLWRNYSSWLNGTTVAKTATPIVVTLRTGTVNVAKLNVRSSPSTKSKILTTLKKNQIVNITSSKSGWHTIKLSNGQTAYVTSSCITERKTNNAAVTVKKTGIVTGAVLNVRNSPSTKGKILKVLKRNNVITISATKNGWHTIKLSNGQTGYVTTAYVRIK